MVRAICIEEGCESVPLLSALVVVGCPAVSALFSVLPQGEAPQVTSVAQDLIGVSRWPEISVSEWPKTAFKGLPLFMSRGQKPWMLDNLNNREVADALYTRVQTLEFHIPHGAPRYQRVRNMLEKLREAKGQPPNVLWAAACGIPFITPQFVECPEDLLSSISHPPIYNQLCEQGKWCLTIAQSLLDKEQSRAIATFLKGIDDHVHNTVLVRNLFEELKASFRNASELSPVVRLGLACFKMAVDWEVIAKANESSGHVKPLTLDLVENQPHEALRTLKTIPADDRAKELQLLVGSHTSNVKLEDWVYPPLTFKVPAYIGPFLRGVKPIATASSYCGLENPRNRCFFNAAMQALRHSPAVSGISHKCSDEKCLLTALESFAKPSSDASGIYNLLMEHPKFKRDFSGDKPACSYEFLTAFRELMDSVHVEEDCPEELKRTTFMGQLFSSTVVSRTRCEECRKFGPVKTESHYDISLGVPQTGTLDVQRAIIDDFADTRVEAKCDSLTKEGPCQHNVKILSKHIGMAPNNLLVTFKRQQVVITDSGAAVGQKSGVVLENFERVDLGPVMHVAAKKNSNAYRLYAGIVHIGDDNGGHYICVARPPNDRDWVRYNDSSVTPLAEADAKEQLKHAYILFYTRKKALEPEIHQ